MEVVSQALAPETESTLNANPSNVPQNTLALQTPPIVVNPIKGTAVMSAAMRKKQAVVYPELRSKSLKL